MSNPAVHILDQGPVLAALGRVAVAAARQRFGLGGDAAAQQALTATVPPRNPELIRDFVRWSGGDPGWYRGVVPPHLFPQWGFPLLGRTLEGISYPLARVLNAGCRIEINAPLSASRPLRLEARLEGIEDDGRRALIHQRLVTGTEEHPEALVAHVYGLVPLGGGDKKARGKDKARPRVPVDAREIGWVKLGPNAGFEFACLTGDFNPVHWVPAYARAAGFGSCILHGFATLARAVETMNRAVFAGDPRRLATVDVKFTRPLRLPARVGVYVRDGALFVGDAPGGPAYLTGEYTTREGTT